jgi:mono/diheme cytochrome c family protein
MLSTRRRFSFSAAAGRRVRVMAAARRCVLLMAAPLILGMAAVPFMFAPAAAQNAPPRGPAAYTAAQAEAGQSPFERHCASCHLADLSGDQGPPLVGAAFAYNWDGKFVNNLLSYVKLNEPMTAPGSLDEPTVVTLVAYILSKNGMAAGSTPLRMDSNGVIHVAPEGGP